LGASDLQRKKMVRRGDETQENVVTEYLEKQGKVSAITPQDYLTVTKSAGKGTSDWGKRRGKVRQGFSGIFHRKLGNPR